MLAATYVIEKESAFANANANVHYSDKCYKCVERCGLQLAAGACNYTFASDVTYILTVYVYMSNDQQTREAHDLCDVATTL